MNEDKLKDLTFLLTQIADIKARIKVLELQEDSLSKVSLQLIHDLGLETQPIETTFGTFTVVGRKSWTYSPEYEEKKLELKALEKEEQLEGIATAEVKNSLRFNPKV